MASLLERLTKQSWQVARAGSQGGRDLGSDQVGGIRCRVECKLNKEATRLDQGALLGKLVEATRPGHQLDAWVLAATCSIPDQLVDALETEARENRSVNVGFLDAPPGRLGRLLALLATFPDVLHPGGPWKSPPVVRRALLQVSSRPDFAAAREALEKVFDPRTLGYPSIRAALQAEFRAALEDRVASRDLFGQLVTPFEAGFISRRAVEEKLDGWWADWPNTGSPVVLHGKEGTGKTWALASWIASRLLDGQEGPLVLWCGSQRFDHSEELPALLARLLRRVAPSYDQSYFRRRVLTWARDQRREPAILLVMDGLNERPEHSWRAWRSTAARDLRTHLRGVAIALTTRSARLSDLHGWLSLSDAAVTAREVEGLQREIPVAEPSLGAAALIEVDDFDDDEFDRALTPAHLLDWEPPPDLRRLMRRPKWFLRALRMRARLQQVGDPTVERLLWEDMKARHDEHDGAPLSDRQYQTFLMQLARKWLPSAGSLVLPQSEILGALGAVSDLTRALDELTSAEILLTVPGSPDLLRLDPPRVPHALGLALLERTSQAAERDPGEVDEVVECTVEDLGDSDLSGAVVAFSVCVALSSQDSTVLPEAVAVALLKALVKLRNGGPAWDRAKPWSFFPVRPRVFLRLAEDEWQGEPYDYSATNRIGYCFDHIAETWTEHRELVAASEQWLALVHPSAFGFQEDSTSAIEERIAGAEASSVQLRNLVTILRASSARHLRLGALAIFVASQARGTAFCRAIANWAFSRAIMNEPLEATQISWLVRLAGDDLRTELRQTAELLSTVPLGAARLAAAILYRMEQSTDSLDLAEALDPRPDSRSPRPRRTPVSDPRSARLAAGRLAAKALDPKAIIDYETISLALLDLDSSDVFRGRTTTRHTLDLHDMEPTLCRVDPESLGRFYLKAARAWIRSVAGEGERRYHSLDSVFLLLTPADFKALRRLARSFWMQSERDAHRERAERTVTGLALAGLVRARDQLRFLLERPENDDNRDWLHLLSLLSRGEVQRIVVALPEASAHGQRRRVMFPWSPGIQLTPREREIIWAAVDTGNLGILRGTPAIEAKDVELTRRGVQAGVYGDEDLSHLLSTEVWMRQALVDQSAGIRLGPASQSWLLTHRGLDPAAVKEWASDMDERLSRPPNRSVLGQPDTYSIEHLEAVLEFAPESAASWISELVAFSAIGHRLADLESGLVESLMVALVNRDDSRALEIVRALETGHYLLRHGQAMALAFKSKKTAMARRVLLCVLDTALKLNDNALQLLCKLAAENHCTQWLRQVAADTHASGRRFEVARSIALLGLGPGNRKAVGTLRRVCEEDSTWIRHVAGWALRQNQGDLWARHWFRAFLEKPSRVEAWAAFRLFFGSLSRLCSLWIRDELDRAGNLPDQEARHRHLQLNVRALNRLLEDQANEMKKRLFGWSVPTGDLKPWKQAWNLD